MRTASRAQLAAGVLLSSLAFGAAASEVLLEQAVAAHGGGALTGLSSITAEWRESWALIHEDREPGPPWNQHDAWIGLALEFERGRLAERRIEAGGGYLYDTALVAGPDGSRRADLRAGVQRFHPALSADAAGAEARRRLPGLVVRRAFLEPQRWQSLPDADCDGTATRRARFDDPGGEAWVLHFDQRTHLTRCLEYTVEPYHGAPVNVTLHYDDWRTIAGLAIPQSIEARGADVHGRQHLQHASTDVPLDVYFEPFDLPVEATPAERGFQVEAIAEGVWVIGEGVFRQLFVELEDYVVAYDGLGGDVDRRLAALAERTGGKPVRYVVLSHPHSDHYPGLRELTAAGAKVVAHPAHWPATRRLAGLEQSDWIPLTGDWVVEDSHRRVVVADIGPTPHSEHLLVMWLPREGVLAQSDLFVRRQGAVRAATPNMKALARVLQERGWQPRMIHDGHSPRLGTAGDLAAAARKRPATLLPVWLTRPQTCRAGPDRR